MEEASVIYILKVLYSKLNRKRKREISFLFSIVILTVIQQLRKYSRLMPSTFY